MTNIDGLKDVVPRTAGQLLNFTPLDNAALLDCDHASDPFGKLAECLRRIVTKKMPHEFIVEHNKKKFAHAYADMLQRFAAGTLFRCHRAGFGTFLQTDPKDIWADETTWTTVAWHLAYMTGNLGAASFKPVDDFYRCRVQPSAGWRRRFLDEHGNLENEMSMTGDLRHELRAARDIYNRNTKRNNWIDDSGTAYDERIWSDPLDRRPS